MVSANGPNLRKVEEDCEKDGRESWFPKQSPARLSPILAH